MLRDRRLVDQGLNVFVALLLFASVAYAVVRSGVFYWDFQVYRDASQVFLHGGDPYAVDHQVFVGFGPASLPYVYPPLTLFVFAPFAFLPPAVAAILWLGLKLGAFALLVRLWRKRFVQLPIDWRFGLFVLFAFNATVYTDLATGNLAIFEALFLYLAMSKLLDGKEVHATLLILAIAAIKFTPIVFLGAILWFGGRQRVRTVVYSGLGFFLYVAANAALFPKFTSGFVALAASRDENRNNNPTLYTFSHDLAFRVPHGSGTVFYFVLAVAVLWVAVKALRTTSQDRTTVVLFAWLTLAMLLPRFMIYSYVQLLPMAWVALRQLKGLARWALAAGIGIVLPGSYLTVAKPAVGQVIEAVMGMKPSVWGYGSLYAAIAIWAIYVMRVLPPDAKRSPNAEALGDL